MNDRVAGPRESALSRTAILDRGLRASGMRTASDAQQPVPLDFGVLGRDSGRFSRIQHVRTDRVSMLKAASLR